MSKMDLIDFSDPAYIEKPSHGRLVRAGVARAEFLSQILRDPRMTAVVDSLTAMANASAPVTVGDSYEDVIAFACERGRRADAFRARTVEQMTKAGQELGIDWIGPWLVEFLAAAVDFRLAVAALDLSACTLTDPSLARARACVRSLSARPDPWSSKLHKAPAISILAGLVPEVEPSAWQTRSPDWIEVFAILVEHACERVDWTDNPSPTARWWQLDLRSEFVTDLEPGDDPEVLHGLVSLWAESCHQLIDKHTETRLPRGQVPDHSGFYADGRVRQGTCDKIRRRVGWYLDREVRGVALNDILRAAFAESDAPLERSSELNRRILDAKSLLAQELPLHPGQPLRLWKLAQEYRDLLELVYTFALDKGLARP